MKIQVTLSTTITVEFDENAQDFKELYANYREHFADVDYEEFAENIAIITAKYGAHDFIEGVGYPKKNGKKYVDYFHGNTEHDCPVNVAGDFDVNDTVDFDVENTEVIDHENLQP